MATDLIDVIGGYVRTSDAGNEQDLKYAKDFLRGFQFLGKALTTKDFARNLDYSKINEEELIWLIQEINKIPTQEEGYDSDDVTPDMVLRDLVFRTAYQVDELNVNSLPAVRSDEQYF